jgi:hypothetical protein
MAASPGLHQSSGYLAAHLSVLSNPWPSGINGMQSGIGAGACPRFNPVVSITQKLYKKAVGKITVKNNN